MTRPRLVYVVTHPVTADLLLRGQLRFMRESGFDVTVVASPGPELTRVVEREGVRGIAVPMTRSVSPARDVESVARLTRVLLDLRPTIVNAGTPKGGLVGMLAARAARVPVRIYLLRGLRLETAQGTLRRVLGVTERIASACATEVACVSHSLLRAATEGGFVPRSKAMVVGPGSSNGVDVVRFARTPERVEAGRRLLAGLGILDPSRTIAFVGRFVADKGVAELLAAFDRVRASLPAASLLLVGSDLGGENVDAELQARARATPGVVLTGTIADLAPIYASVGVLAFPSRREGFPNVVLEAACAGLPAVGFRATGTTDAILDGVTGELVPAGDVPALARALEAHIVDAGLRSARGAAAEARAHADFASERVWAAWLQHYRARSADGGSRRREGLVPG